ncbi:MAG: GNAT family N-acetyltransferase [Candidatus Acidiferrales bacterium]
MRRRGGLPRFPLVIFKLRTYQPADFAKLYQIDQACYEPEIAYSRRELRHYMRFPGLECVVAEAESRVVGFCLAAGEEGLGYVITMDVLAAYRRRGIASALLESVEQRLAARQVSVVWLETATDNDAAIAFWQRHGYRKHGVRKDYYPGGRDAYTMRKSIVQPAGA